MREIKFRAWDKSTLAVPGDAESQLGFLLPHPKDFALMQFTGLQDNNERDIYEGDILFYLAKASKKKKRRTDEKHYYEGYFDRGQWKMKRGIVDQALFDKVACHEVIGNIYENVDLVQ